MRPTALQLDALAELINIGVGRAAGVLNQMVGSPIQLSVPAVQVLRASELPVVLHETSREILAYVRLPFSGFVQGTAALVFPTTSAAKLVTLLTHDDPNDQDLDSLRSGTLCEVGNIVINGVMGSIANILHVRLSYGLPTFLDATAEQLFRPVPNADPVVVLAHTRFAVENQDISGAVLLIFEVVSFDTLLAAVDAISAL